MTEGTVVGRTGDVPDGEARRFDVDGEPVCVDACRRRVVRHRRHLLARGVFVERRRDVWADDCEIECPKHGAMFSLRTGEPLTLPATRPVPTYSVHVDGDNLVVAVKEGADS